MAKIQSSTSSFRIGCLQAGRHGDRLPHYQRGEVRGRGFLRALCRDGNQRHGLSQ